MKPLEKDDDVPSTPQPKPEPEISEQVPQATRPRALAVTKTPPSRRLQPGDLICGTCGEGNPPTRRFCSRCGASLIEALRVRDPWWRRLLRKLMPRRGPRVVKIGSRKYGPDNGKPGGAAHLAKSADVRGAFLRILRVVRIAIGVLLLIGGLLYGVYPPLRNAVNGQVGSVKTKITSLFSSSLSPIHPMSVTANSTVKGSSPLNASDERLGTYWLAPWSDSSHPVITFKFSRHVTLRRMILHSGADGDFVQMGRPAILLLSFSNGETLTLTPQDTAQGQTLTISHAELITSVQIQVTGINPGASGSNVAMTEIEWFGYNT